MTSSTDDPSLLAVLRRRASALDARIVLPESADPRVLAAATAAAASQLCQPILIGTPGAFAEAGHKIPEGCELLDPAADPALRAMAEELAASPLARGRTVAQMEDRLSDPLHYACALVRQGRADGAILGAVATTADTLRAALRVVGVDPRYRVVTSCFLMALTDGRQLIYADCGVLPVPTSEQLADIAMQAAESYRFLVGGDPRVAMLSFSTHGSARHSSLDPVSEAVRLLAERDVDFVFDGELQVDAALVPEIAARKAVASPVAGSANVLVFPDLNSGNIAYKLTERLAHARAIGPLLQGLARPIHDLSRGCSADDILDTMAITALDAARRNDG